MQVEEGSFGGMEEILGAEREIVGMERGNPWGMERGGFRDGQRRFLGWRREVFWDGERKF